MSKCINRLAVAGLLFSSLFFLGCGQGDRPPLGYVSGTVTMDGEPLEGAIVAFMPEKGRMATATTTKDGTFDIEYVQGAKGSKIGPNTVTFFPPTSGPLSHPIPAKYSDPQTSEFQVEVQRGRNTFEFTLESEDTSKKKGKTPPTGIVD